MVQIHQIVTLVGSAIAVPFIIAAVSTPAWFSESHQRNVTSTISVDVEYTAGLFRACLTTPSNTNATVFEPVCQSILDVLDNNTVYNNDFMHCSASGFVAGQHYRIAQGFGVLNIMFALSLVGVCCGFMFHQPGPRWVPAALGFYIFLATAGTTGAYYYIQHCVFGSPTAKAGYSVALWWIGGVIGSLSGVVLSAIPTKGHAETPTVPSTIARSVPAYSSI